MERMERWDCQLNKERCCGKVTSEAAMARDQNNVTATMCVECACSL